jgi:tetratricopeptide (TPR) repeat protein
MQTKNLKDKRMNLSVWTLSPYYALLLGCSAHAIANPLDIVKARSIVLASFDTELDGHHHNEKHTSSGADGKAALTHASRSTVAGAKLNKPVRKGAVVKNVNAEPKSLVEDSYAQILSQIRDAERIGHAGSQADFVKAMSSIEKLAKDIPGLSSNIARTWIKFSQSARAVQYLEKSNSLDATATVLYGWALLNTRQDEKLNNLLSKLDAQQFDASTYKPGLINQVNVIRRRLTARQMIASVPVSKDKVSTISDIHQPLSSESSASSLPKAWDIFHQSVQLRDQGKGELARQQISTLLASDFSLDASYAASLFYAADKQWTEALSAMARIPVKDRSAAMTELQFELEVQGRLNEATRMALAGKKSESINEMQELEKLAHGRPALTLSVASAWMEQGEYQHCVSFFEQRQPLDASATVQYAWALLRVKQDDKLAALLVDVESGKSGLAFGDRELQSQLKEIRTYLAERKEEALRHPFASSAVAGDDLPSREESGISDLEMGYVIRSKPGTAGLSALYEQELPMAWHMPMAARSAQMVFKATPVKLNAGDLAFLNMDQFGKNNANVPPAAPLSYPVNAQGVAFSVGYQSKHFDADIGTSPLGFQFSTLVGGMRLNDNFGRFNLAFELTRRSVTESVLSYAGAVDNVTGASWGGVTKNGGKVAAYRPITGKWAAYASAGAYAYLGTNVASNSSNHLDTALIYDVERSENREISLALALSASHFKNNLSYFYWGHGGYYSPQQQLTLGIPMHYASRSEKYSHKLDVVASLANSRSDPTPIYPTNAILQANAVAPGFTPLDAAGLVPQSSKSVGLGALRVEWTFEYKLSPQVVLGNRLNYDGSSTYKQVGNMLFLRYVLDQHGERLELPPSPVVPYYIISQGGAGHN